MCNWGSMIRQMMAMNKPQFTVVTLMPDMVRAFFQDGLVGEAIDQERIGLKLISLREFGKGAHHTVDDRIFGGSDGMLLKPEPLSECLDLILKDNPNARLIHLSPRGKLLTSEVAQSMAANLSQEMVLISSRYAGIDERLIQEYSIEEVSIGDYVLTGGELAACVVIEVVSRFIPGVLGNSESSKNDSFQDGLLEGPQYTRPQTWRGHSVPEVLLCGDQKLITDYEKLSAIETTLRYRPELIIKEGELRGEQSDKIGQYLRTVDVILSGLETRRSALTVGNRNLSHFSKVIELGEKLKRALQSAKHKIKQF